MNIPATLKRLFWDIELKSIYDKKNCDFVIERVAEKGNEKDIKWLINNFGKKEIYRIIKKSRNITDKTKNFYQVVR